MSKKRKMPFCEGTFKSNGILSGASEKQVVKLEFVIRNKLISLKILTIKSGNKHPC